VSNAWEASAVVRLPAASPQAVAPLDDAPVLEAQGFGAPEGALGREEATLTAAVAAEGAATTVRSLATQTEGAEADASAAASVFDERKMASEALPVAAKVDAAAAWRPLEVYRVESATAAAVLVAANTVANAPGVSAARGRRGDRGDGGGGVGGSGRRSRRTGRRRRYVWGREGQEQRRESGGGGKWGTTATGAVKVCEERGGRPTAGCRATRWLAGAISKMGWTSHPPDAVSRSPRAADRAVSGPSPGRQRGVSGARAVRQYGVSRRSAGHCTVGGPRECLPSPPQGPSTRGSWFRERLRPYLRPGRRGPRNRGQPALAKASAAPKRTKPVEMKRRQTKEGGSRPARARFIVGRGGPWGAPLKRGARSHQRTREGPTKATR